MITNNVGRLLADSGVVQVNSVTVGDEGDVSVEMISPNERGIYQSRWQMNTPQGMPFGGTINTLLFLTVKKQHQS